MQTVMNGIGGVVRAKAYGFSLRSRTVITSTGASTYTPPSGCRAVLFECIGSGAGGFNTVNATAGQLIAAGGGASGSYSQSFVTVLPNETFAVTVGAGGGTSGGNGAVTSVTSNTSGGVLCSGQGGTTGTTITTGTSEIFGTNGGATTGTASGEVVYSNTLAQVGHRVSGSVGISGRGGSIGFGRAQANIAQGNGPAGGKYGAGGTGGVSINAGGTSTGGAGGQGLFIAWEFV